MNARDCDNPGAALANSHEPTGFAIWQRRYAEHNVAIFPVEIIDATRKKPMIANYNRLGLHGSEQLTLKYGAASSFGFMAGKRIRITVIDLDEAIFNVAEGLFGGTRLAWAAGGGKFAMAFRRGGEPRLVRPIPGLPIDVLGGGVIVAPGSRGWRQPYWLIRGTLADLDHLSPAHLPAEIARLMKPAISPTTARIARGRNDALFRTLLRHALRCDGIEALCDVARTINDMNLPSRWTVTSLRKRHDPPGTTSSAGQTGSAPNRAFRSQKRSCGPLRATKTARTPSCYTTSCASITDATRS